MDDPAHAQPRNVLLDTKGPHSLDAKILVRPARVVAGCEDEAAICLATVSVPDDRRDRRRAHETACDNGITLLIVIPAFTNPEVLEEDK